ncbi:PREDICTED: uncharacterized protein LOC104772543 [Camelina sativa]|uniref:Uncharacterized protein LOC104772543 n=1 Tax=Camelina sativa TaxID=90675 RepID=A0ABM0Y4Q0_CAMSA|nr:PREDICTED: uncharacterized protein LOC104772543 [Camelina sativa]
MERACPGWKFISNHMSDADGRIIVIWKDPATVRVMHQSRQTLTCEVTVGNKFQFVFTSVYASNVRKERTDLWVELMQIQSYFSLHTCPWLVGGDFNQITHFEEHSSPDVNYLTPPMTELRDCLSQLELFDLRFQGPFYTWTNNQPASLVAKKLGRVLQERDLHTKWNFLRAIEESYFRQKSRVNWLKEGDLNTSYFHKMCQSRANYNTIRSFMLDTGELLLDPEQMSIHAISHFQAILGPENLPQCSIRSSLAWFQNLNPFRISSHHSQLMLMVPTPPDITKVMHKLNPNKAPGPDGYTLGFYKAVWSTLGPEVISSITQFFHSSFLPSSTNATILALIPKKPGASSIKDYRPISCLNTLYKVVSKLLVAKIKPILPSLILPNQTAFLTDRLLLENTVLAAEIVNGYHKSQGPKRIVIKVDIAKAFDTLSWDFLFTCLKALEIPNQYLRWLQACICTPNFTIGYNGTVQGYFKGRRGLRQGDPLSPYLFVIAMNNLSLMLNKAAEEGKFLYHHNCDTAKLTHLCFADDLLIFVDGSVSSVQNVLEVLKEFEERPGLAISLQKSSFYSGGLTEEEIDSITVATGLPHGTLPVRYLGVPLCTKKLTLQNCEPLLQQVKGKINNWCSKSLSFAGRLVLINTVIAGISNFWCSTFLLPKACIRKINTMCSSFLWKGHCEGRHNARVSWDNITKPKDQGGLGIRDLATWNTACVLKLIWLLFFRSGLVWVAWYRLHFLRGSLSSFWTMKKRPNFSWLANKLLKVKDMAYNWIKLRVGNGITCRFWSDNWSPFGNLSTFLSTTRLGICATATLAQVYNHDNWRLPNPRSDNQVSLHAHLTTLHLSEEEDHYEWEMQGKIYQKYSTRRVYDCIVNQSALVPWRRAVWNKGGIPRHSFLTWLFTLNRCRTRARLLGWGFQTDPRCLLCNSCDESWNHLFFNCHYSWSVWSQIAARCTLQPCRNWDANLEQMSSLRGPKEHQRLCLLAWQCSLYTLWNERNTRLHRQNFRSVESTLKLIDSTIRNRIDSFRATNPSVSSLMLQLWFSTLSSSSTASVTITIPSPRLLNPSSLGSL